MTHLFLIMSLLDESCHKKNSSLVHVTCSPFILEGILCQRRMIYITNQFYVSVVTYVTITSNRMTVPITSINYIKYPSIKSLFDKIGSKKYNSLIHITCSTSILEVVYWERRMYFILLAFFHVSVVITCVTTVTPNLMISENHE